MPFFSIVTPAFNRQREIRRAIESCLAQDFTDFEQIVVDDGSTDDTASVVVACSDDRVRLIRHARNRGVCPARNTAIRASKGEWIIYLDSDDELLAGCLSRIWEVLSGDRNQIGRLGFRYQLDDGRVSPTPLPPDRILGYEDWLRFLESSRWGDALWVTRRSTFDRCMMPDTYALEFKYNLDFCRNFTWRIVPEILAVEHTDSSARITSLGHSDNSPTEQRRAADCLEDWTATLAEHGPLLRKLAPRAHQGALRGRAISYLLSGRRCRAIRASGRCVFEYPANVVNWAVLASTLAGPRTTQWVRRWRALRAARARLRGKEVGAWAPQR